MKSILFASLLLFAAVSASASSSSVVRNAKIYALDKASGEPVFTQTSQFDTDEKGVTHEVTSIHDMKGQAVLTQESHFKGEHLLDLHVKQYQTGKAYQVKVEGSHITFSTFEFDGNNERPSNDKDQSEQLEKSFVTGPVSEEFLKDHWDSLMAGDTIHARFGVLEIAETVGFKFWKVDSPPNTIDIRMKPSSLFIGLAVKPIDIFFDPSTRSIVGYKGRTPLRVRDQGKWIPFNGNIVYSN